MTRSDAEVELVQFNNGSYKRVYRYKQEFIPDHYVTVQRYMKVHEDGSTEESFTIDKNESTINIDGFDKEMFIILLMKEELKHNDNGRWFMKIRDLRTDSCVCGAWATSNADCHTDWCVKRTRVYGAGHE